MESKLNNIITELRKGNEFEARFNYQQPSLTIDTFQNLLNKIKNSEFEYVITQSLDVSCNDTKSKYNSYRISVNKLENINHIIQTLGIKSNEMIIKLLVAKYLKKEDDIEFIHKDKEALRTSNFDDTEYNLRFKLAVENNVSSKDAKEFLKNRMIDIESITFRYKHRISLIILNEEGIKIQLDLTSVKQEKNLSKISLAPSKYELELEIFKLDDSKVKKNITSTYISWIQKVLSWIAKTDIFIPKAEIFSIISQYKTLFSLNETSIKLYAMQPVTLDLPKLTDALAGNYAVCDKADGERCGLFIFNKKIYYLSNTLEVTYSGLTSEKYPDMTYAEGEYVDGRFMLFDIFFLNNKDVRKETLVNRIKILDELIKIINKDSYKFRTYSKDKFELKSVIDFYKKDLIDYVKYLNENKKLIDRKYFLFPIGFDVREIFAYSVLIWEELRKGPYMLDGLIYTGMQQIYTTIQKDIAFPILKWKPEDLNSIDMYIEFVKNDRGEIENVYDNSSKEEDPNRIFKIANLFVGKVKNNEETPTLFMKDKKLHQAFFYVDKSSFFVRDIQGIIVNDKTVVELAYKSDDSIIPEKRWVILRTRYDKTYTMQNFQRQYGNNEFVAKKIFDTIINPIRFNDLELLAADYTTNIVNLRKRVSTKLIEISKQEDAYYQFVSELGKPMRKYHNFVKDILFIYLHPKRIFNTNKFKKLSVLDFGIGRGGDIMKYYHNRVGELVGIDPDVNGLYNASDSAYSRYDTQRKKKPYFTKMTFIQSSAAEKLNLESQQKIFPLMSEENKKYITTNFNNKKKYDCISAQFSLHYLFTTEGFNNMIYNINTYLAKDGYFLVTTLDALLIKEYLGENSERSEYFTDETGTKRTFFTIRNVNFLEKEGLDQAYDFFTAMFMPDGRFETEYLVYPDFFIKEMETKCNLKLIETLRFKDLMKLEENFFMKSIDSEADIRRKKFLEEDVKQFYTNTGDLHDASVKLSHLNRYYVFQSTK